jgi:hypothetical protein
VHIRVHLLCVVLRVHNGLNVVLDVVYMTLMLLVAFHLLDFMTLVSLVCDGRQMLDILLYISLLQVHVRPGTFMALPVRNASILGMYIGRSSKCMLDLVRARGIRSSCTGTGANA